MGHGVRVHYAVLFGSGAGRGVLYALFIGMLGHEKRVGCACIMQCHLGAERGGGVLQALFVGINLGHEKRVEFCGWPCEMLRWVVRGIFKACEKRGDAGGPNALPLCPSHSAARPLAAKGPSHARASPCCTS